MKAVTTITLTKELSEEFVPVVENMMQNDPQQLEDAIKLLKDAATEIFAKNGETVNVTFNYYK